MEVESTNSSQHPVSVHGAGNEASSGRSCSHSPLRSRSEQPAMPFSTEHTPWLDGEKFPLHHPQHRLHFVLSTYCFVAISVMTDAPCHSGSLELLLYWISNAACSSSRIVLSALGMVPPVCYCSPLSDAANLSNCCANQKCLEACEACQKLFDREVTAIDDLRALGG